MFFFPRSSRSLTCSPGFRRYIEVRNCKEPGTHIGHDHPCVFRQFEAGCHAGSDRLNIHSDVAFNHATRLAELLVHKADGVTGYGKSGPFGLQHRRVDANQVAGCIYQGTTAVSRIHCRVSLNINARTVGINLSCNGTDNAYCCCISHPEWTTESHHHLALLQIFVVRKLESRKPTGSNFEHSEVCLVMYTDNYSIKGSSRNL